MAYEPQLFDYIPTNEITDEQTLRDLHDTVNSNYDLAPWHERDKSDVLFIDEDHEWSWNVDFYETVDIRARGRRITVEDVLGTKHQAQSNKALAHDRTFHDVNNFLSHFGALYQNFGALGKILMQYQWDDGTQPNNLDEAVIHLKAGYPLHYIVPHYWIQGYIHREVVDIVCNGRRPTFDEVSKMQGTLRRLLIDNGITS